MDVLLLIPGTLSVIGALVVARVLLVPGGVTIDDLLQRTDHAWPRGVQEEEPVHWRFERLTPPGHRRAERLAAGEATRSTQLALPRRHRRGSASSAR
jgi:hypothetical protein